MAMPIIPRPDRGRLSVADALFSCPAQTDTARSSGEVHQLNLTGLVGGGR